MTATELLAQLRHLVEVEKRGDDEVIITAGGWEFEPVGADHKGQRVRIVGRTP